MLYIRPFDERTIAYRPLCGHFDDCIIPDQRTFIITSYNFSLDAKKSIPKVEGDSNALSSGDTESEPNDLEANHPKPPLPLEKEQPTQAKNVKELIEMYDHK